jgi:adenylate cyclase
MKFSIASKLILATLFLVMGAAIPLAYQSSRYFEDVSKEKEEEANASFAHARATETENILKALLEKSKNIGILALSSNKVDKSIDLLLENDRDIFAVDVYQMEDGDLRLKRTLVKRQKFQELGTDETLLDRIRSQTAFPLESVAQGQIEIMTSTNDDDLPLMTFGLPISRNGLGQVDAVTVTYFQLTRLQRAFARATDRISFLVDSRGTVLAHPDEEKILKAASMKDHPVVAQAITDSAPNARLAFKYPNTGAGYQGAYVRSPLGPIVVSEISDAYVLEPSRKARRQSMFIAGIVLSLSFLLVFLLSLSFSSPIEKLATLIREVSGGNLEVTAKDKIQTRDEVAELAVAFDEMVVGLRERAKAYAVMRQALGSSVIETLMTMKEEELGGMRKPVTVLFSDLRDFTKFSEGHTPEEVVIMLNEYFDLMVKIIAKHGGWLDKFIGDAIMAVWGVPYTGEGDDQRAMQAALEMRMALLDLNQLRESRGQGPVKIGIGLHTGDAIVGKIGAAERANLTVIGDTVNQASRIEASTKTFGTDILISEELAEKIDTKFMVICAGSVDVKGKANALKLFKVRGYFDGNGQPVELKTPYSDYEASGDDKIKAKAG